MEHTKTPERADPITRLLARRVVELRDSAGMSQTQLGKRMSELRTGWTRSTVVKLEKNLRESVSVGDLFALALALDVPPVMLLADPRGVDEVPIAKDVSANPWEALTWLIGAHGVESDRRDSPEFEDASWYVAQASALGDALRALEAAARVTGTRDEDGRLTRDPAVVTRIVEGREREALELIRAVLKRIAAARAPLPALPEHVVRRAAELDVELPGVGS